MAKANSSNPQLSVAPITGEPSAGITAFAQPGDTPNAGPSIEQGLGTNISAQVTSQTGGFLRYPGDIPKYIMTFSISKYHRDNLTSIGKFSDAGYPGIILPLPLQLVDTNHVDWRDTELGMLPGTIVQSVSGIFKTVQQSKTNNELPSAVATEIGQQAVKGLVATAAVAATKTLIESPVGQGVQAFGIAPNQFITMLMKGPTFKRHIFTWNFSPNNFKEANDLRKIINVFKNAMAPNLYTFLNEPVLWTFPKIFRIRLYPNSKFLYKFKPCICDFFTVNYAPGGHLNFHTNTTNVDGDNSPLAYQIQAHFIELEFWVEGNYSHADKSGDGGALANDPDDIYEAAAETSLT